MSEEISQSPELLMLLLVLQNLLLFAVTVGIYLAGTFVLRRIRGKSASGYGLGPLGFRKPRGGYLANIGLGIASGFGALILIVVLNAVSSLVLDRLGLPADNSAQEPLMNSVQSWVSESPGIAIPLAFFTIVLLGPAVEELLFRGAIFGGLYRLFTLVAERSARRITVPDVTPPGLEPESGSDSESGSSESKSVARSRLPFILSAALSSGLFTLAHLSPVLVVSLFVLAFVLCELYRRSGSLLLPFVTHATFNSFTVISLVLLGLDVIQPPQV